MITEHTLLDPNVWAALEALPALGSTDEMTTDRPAVKLFHAIGQAFWVLWEFDPETRTAFGYADLYGDGAFGELGYVDVGDIADQLSWQAERDIAVETLVQGYQSRNVPVPDYLVSP